MKEKQLLPTSRETQDQKRFPFYYRCRRIWDDEALAYYPVEPDEYENSDDWDLEQSDFGDQD